MISSFAIFTYTGSLYLQKNALTSFFSTAGRRWMISRMFRSATYCTSGPDESSATGGTGPGQRGGRGASGRRTERRAHLLADVLDQLPVLDVVHQVQQDLDRGEHDGRIGMLELDDDPLRELLRVYVPLGHEAQERVEDVDLAPPT
jgi:hypothetical protein